MPHPSSALLFLLTALQVSGEIVAAKLAITNDNDGLMARARDGLGTCADNDGPRCGRGCCNEGETCCEQSGECAFPGWVCYGQGIMPQGSDRCGDSYFCEPGSSCIKCPRDSPLFPFPYCCNKPQSSIVQYIPSGYSLSSSFGFPLFSILSSLLPAPSTSSYATPTSAVAPSPSSSLQQSSSRQAFSHIHPSTQTQSSTRDQTSSLGGLDYHDYTTTWVYSYMVCYTTAEQQSVTRIMSTTTTATTTLTCRAVNQRAAASIFSTSEQSISAQATSMQFRASSSLFAAQGAQEAQGAASASQQGGSMAHAVQVNTATLCLLVIAGLLPGILAIVL